MLAVVLLFATAVAAGPSSGVSCLPNGPAAGLPFCNASLPTDARVANLLSLLSLPEKLSLLGGDTNFNTCPLLDAGVARLGIPPYMWLVETNTAVASACYGPGQVRSLWDPLVRVATWLEPRVRSPPVAVRDDVL